MRITLINKESELGFARHNYDSKYYAGIKEEARDLQKAAKAFAKLYGEDATHTKNAAKDYTIKFQGDFCAKHDCSKEVATFAVQKHANSCSTVEEVRVPIKDYIKTSAETFAKVVEAVCAGEIACEN